MVIDSPMLDGSSDSPPSRLCSVCGCSFSPQTGSAHSPAHCPSCEHSSNGRRPKRRTRLEPHSCHVCHKTFISSAHLTLHLASHNKERKFCCGICGKHFKQKSHLEAHRLIHTGERPFKCPECGKCFGRAAHLKTHRRIHSGEKPFQCFICGKSFTQKSGLMAHIQRHANKRLSAPSHTQRPQPTSGPDDLKCGVCCRVFVRSSYYRLHKRLRRGYRPYHCRVCNKTFAKLESFGNHCDKHLRLKKEKKEEMEERAVLVSPQPLSSEPIPEIQSSPKAKAKIKAES
ncbi:oocyte zinc finger protein XlCOF6.1-like [Periophthalmus magnuspinnatus]|uniref:oocyte zinc finger protein XlCOF6.1-like n=1 Tax=Periophthalmus magnuspinnatus TaxID=409849 RepID=UPI00145B76B3|nr:oocyte zinc finger protein XlCOF6.1-like [Periophthalmus magnuspinnatus]